MLDTYQLREPRTPSPQTLARTPSPHAHGTAAPRGSPIPEEPRSSPIPESVQSIGPRRNAPAPKMAGNQFDEEDVRMMNKAAALAGHYPGDSRSDSRGGARPKSLPDVPPMQQASSSMSLHKKSLPPVGSATNTSESSFPNVASNAKTAALQVGPLRPKKNHTPQTLQPLPKALPPLGKGSMPTEIRPKALPPLGQTLEPLQSSMQPLEKPSKKKKKRKNSSTPTSPSEPAGLQKKLPPLGGLLPLGGMTPLPSIGPKSLPPISKTPNKLAPLAPLAQPSAHSRMAQSPSHQQLSGGYDYGAHARTPSKTSMQSGGGHGPQVDSYNQHDQYEESDEDFMDPEVARKLDEECKAMLFGNEPASDFDNDSEPASDFDCSALDL